METVSTEHFYRAQLGQGVGTFHPTSLLPERACGGSCWHQWQTPSDSNWHQDMGLGAHLFSEQLVEGLGNIHFGEANRGGLSAPQPPPHAALPLQSSRGTPQSIPPRGISTFLVTVIQYNCNWQPNTFGTDLCFNRIFMVKLSFLIFFKSSLCSCYFAVAQW